MIIKKKKKNYFIIGLTVSIHHLKANHDTLKNTATNVLFLFYFTGENSTSHSWHVCGKVAQLPLALSFLHFLIQIFLFKGGVKSLVQDSAHICLH